MRRPAKYTKAGNYLLRSGRSRDLIKFAILVDAGRVRGHEVLNQNNFWAGTAVWETKMFFKYGLCEYRGDSYDVQLTELGREMFDGALALSPLTLNKRAVLREIDSRTTE